MILASQRTVSLGVLPQGSDDTLTPEMARELNQVSCIKCICNGVEGYGVIFFLFFIYVTGQQ
jgi:anti-sigma-K factor RskA